MSVLDQWAHARVQTFELPSGLKAEVEALDLRECLRYGKVPNALIGYAQQVETGVVEPSKMEEKESNEWFDFRMWVIADGIKSVSNSKGEKEEGPLDPDWVAQNMPPMDRELIWSFRTHLYNAEAAQELMTLLSAASFRDESASNGNRASRRAKRSPAK
jgi:hypothetical protein